MKDLYSFHTSEEDFEKYYERAKTAYAKVFKRCGVEAILTYADGGTFSAWSHEYQVLTENGEDTIFYCNHGECGFSENKEIAKVKEGDKCPKCKKEGRDGEIKEGKAIEVGNIFPLKDKYSQAFDYTYTDKEGKEHPVLMGCYGIGISRLMGAIVEVFHDKKGIIWPKEVAPYQVHLIGIGDKKIMEQAEDVYKKLVDSGVEVLFDDRNDVSTGEKFADCDLIGVPTRLVVSEKVGKGKVEVKDRDSDNVKLMTVESFINS